MEKVLSDPLLLRELSRGVDEQVARATPTFDKVWVRRHGRVWVRESPLERRERARSPNLDQQAYTAFEAAYAGDAETFDAFLAHLFAGWRSFPASRQSALRLALFEELKKGFSTPAGMDRPWCWPEEHPSPTGWLATRIWHESTSILRHWHGVDAFVKAAAASPLTPDQQVRGAGTAAQNLVDEVGHDHDHVLDYVADQGAPVSKARARTIQQALAEQWELVEVIEAVGGEHAWRAIKTTLRTQKNF